MSTLVDSRLEPIVAAAVAFSAKATWNKRICGALSQLLHDCHQVAKTSEVKVNTGSPSHKKSKSSTRTQVLPEYRQFYKLVFDLKNWVEAHSKNQTRMSRKTIVNLLALVKSALADASKVTAKSFPSIAYDSLEQDWEDDVIQFLEKHNSLCLILWVDEAGAEADEASLTNLDTEEIAVFRWTTANCEEKLAKLTHLGDYKFDARIRLVLNCKEPATILRQLNQKKYSFIRTVPAMVNTGNIKANFEEAIQELNRVRPDVITSGRTDDINMFCAFATLLWIDNGKDEERAMVEKRARKGGVMLVKTESTEKGLRFLETHGFFGKINPFRIIIGDDSPAPVPVVKPKKNFLEKALSKDADKDKRASKEGSAPTSVEKDAGGEADKKKDDGAAEEAAEPKKEGKGKRKASAAVNTDDSMPSIELVEILRNRLKWVTPIMVYYSHIEAENLAIYNFKSTRLSGVLDEAVNFASMKPLSWAPDMSYYTNADAASREKQGMLRIASIKCNNLAPKDSNGKSDPYYVITIGDTKIKGQKILETLNPVWTEVNHEIACKLSDHISIEMWDWDRIGSDDFEGYVEFDLKDFMPAPITLLELVMRLKPKKDHSDNVTGTITLDLGFRLQVESAPTPTGKHFGRTLKESIELCDSSLVPHLIDKAISFIRTKALKAVGIFRLPGNARRIGELKQMIDDGADIDLDTDDEFDVSSLLKLFFRELPDPLLPSELYDEFRKGNDAEDKNAMIEHFQKVFTKVPELNREIMIELVQLCSDIAQHEDINKMPARNLATCLAPTLIIPANYSAPPVQILTDTKITTDLFEFVILNHAKVFKPFLEEAEAHAKAKKEKVKRKRKQTVSENTESAAQITKDRANCTAEKPPAEAPLRSSRKTFKDKEKERRPSKPRRDSDGEKLKVPSGGKKRRSSKSAEPEGAEPASPRSPREEAEVVEAADPTAEAAAKDSGPDEPNDDDEELRRIEEELRKMEEEEKAIEAQIAAEEKLIDGLSGGKDEDNAEAEIGNEDSKPADAE